MLKKSVRKRQFYINHASHLKVFIKELYLAQIIALSMTMKSDNFEPS